MTHKSKPLTENVTFCPLGLKVFFWEIFRLEDFVFENIFRRTSDHFVPSVPPLASWACPPEKLIKPDKDKTFEFRPLIICLPIQSWAHLSFLLTINHAPCSVLVGWSWNWGKINAKWLIPSPFLLVRFIQGSKPPPSQHRIPPFRDLDPISWGKPHKWGALESKSTIHRGKGARDSELEMPTKTEQP